MAAKKTTIELTKEELRRLTEMAAFTLTALGMDKNEVDVRKINEWKKLGVKLMDIARKDPDLSKDMELQHDLGYWFFKPKYVEKAFYSDLLDEMRDTIFWEELVYRMAEHTLMLTLPESEAEKLSDEERHSRIAALEHALLTEVTQHGIDRLVFLAPEPEN